MICFFYKRRDHKNMYLNAINTYILCFIFFLSFCKKKGYKFQKLEIFEFNGKYVKSY